MSKWEYKIVPWKALVSVTGELSASNTLEAGLNEQGAQGWRFDRQVTLQVGTRMVEYAVFAKETDDSAV